LRHCFPLNRHQKPAAGKSCESVILATRIAEPKVLEDLFSDAAAQSMIARNSNHAPLAVIKGGTAAGIGATIKYRGMLIEDRSYQLRLVVRNF